MSPEEREQRIREIAERLAQRLAEEWPDRDLTVNDIEDLAERLGHDVQREITDCFLHEQAERKDGHQATYPCGETAYYRRHNELTVVTTGGRIRVRRAYYYCSRCCQGHCLADTRLGLGPANTTPATQARLSEHAALATYVQVPDLVAQLGLPLQLDVKSTERVAQGIGARLATTTLRPYGPAARSVAVGFDGVMIPTREGYKEARCGVIYEPDWEAGRTPEAEASLRKEYFATIGRRESLVRAVCQRARERAGGGVVVVVCGGAALDWLALEAHLPLRVEILDFYQVLERIAEIGRAMYGADTAAAAPRRRLKKELLEIGPWELLRQLRTWVPETEATQEIRRVQLAYFERQQERMRYPDYVHRGYPIRSGAVEGACKHVVADRFDGGGMRWKLETADPVNVY